jgi:hypothetical protein
MGVQAMLSGHPHARRERLCAQEVVFLGQAPTFLPDGTPQPTASMGPVQITTRAASLRYLTAAFPPERVH